MSMVETCKGAVLLPIKASLNGGDGSSDIALYTIFAGFIFAYLVNTSILQNMKQELHFEHGDLTGEISLTLLEGQSLNNLFSKYIHDFNPDRLEAYAMRVLLGKENILTLYAVDTYRQENSTEAPDKIPVKKYKVPGVPLAAILEFFGTLNFTVTTGNFPLESLQVINK